MIRRSFLKIAAVLPFFNLNKKTASQYQNVIPYVYPGNRIPNRYIKGDLFLIPIDPNRTIEDCMRERGLL